MSSDPKEDLRRFDINNRRYIGGKSELLTEIFKAIPENFRKGKFVDIFAGTGVVASEATKYFSSVVVNDLLFSNQAIYEAFFGTTKYSKAKLIKFVDFANIEMKKDKNSNYFDKHFGGKFFSKTTARQIGFVRNLIDENDFNLNKRERNILLASLLYSADRIANTVGHYEAYRKKNEGFKDFILGLVNPLDIPKSEIFRRDANELVREIKADVYYIDPPYNSRQYSRFYHVLETLTKWDSPVLSGVALKPPPENISEYCKTGAPEAFADLINNINAKLIIVSYNNTYNSKSSSSKNKITLEQIEKVMRKKGSTRIKRIEHKAFSAGNTDFDNHLEYLFITEVAR
jgi:adenine-specific DNA-methyltransferase